MLSIIKIRFNEEKIIVNVVQLSFHLDSSFIPNENDILNPKIVYLHTLDCLINVGSN